MIGVETALVADLDKTTRQLEPGGLEQTGYGIKGRHGLMTPAAVIRNFLNEARVGASVSNKGAGEPTAAVVRVFCFQTWPAGW